MFHLISKLYRIYELEKKMKTPAKFQYPGFETINWFAAKKLLKELKELNNEGKKCPAYLLQGVKALLSILKQWNTDKDVSSFFSMVKSFYHRLCISLIFLNCFYFSII